MLQVCQGQQVMPLVTAGGPLVKLAGGKLEKEEYGESSTGRGSLLGTTPHFTRSFSFTEGTAYGKLLKGHRNCFLVGNDSILSASAATPFHTPGSLRLSLS